VSNLHSATRSALPANLLWTRLSLVALFFNPRLREAYPMAMVVNIHHAKTHLSKIVDEAAAGREVIIAKAGRQVARLVPIETKPRPKRLGGLRGRFRVPDDFNAPLDASQIAAFEGRS
jgi:prevent-host-death family protein